MGERSRGAVKFALWAVGLAAAGAVSSVALAAASMVFSFLVGSSTQYSLVYGSLASVIIMLVWLYLCGNVLILGSVFNYVLYRWRKETQAKDA